MDIMIMRPFNIVFFTVTLLFILLLIIGSVVLNKKDVKTCENVLVTISLLTMVGFFVYKLKLSMDVEYNELRANMGGFNWWNELPLHLCNINMVLLPIAVKLKKRPLLAFCFFIGPLGAIMALTMPGPDFSNVSILLPRMLGFYGTHFMVVIEGLSLGTLGLYKPKYKDIPMTCITLFLTAAVIHMINLTMRFSGLYDRANYFYTMETEGNGLLDLFHSLIPFPFFYLLPSLLVVAVYTVAVITIFNLFTKKEIPANT